MKKKISLFYIIAACTLWGTSGIFVHFMAPLGFSSLHMTFIRAIVATFFLGLYILISNPSLFKTKLKDLILYIGCGTTFLLFRNASYINFNSSYVNVYRTRVCNNIFCHFSW